MTEGREAGRSLMKREKSTGPRTDPCGTPRWTQKSDVCDFEKPRKCASQKGKIESNEQSKEGGRPAGRNKLVEKGMVSDSRADSLGEE